MIFHSLIALCVGFLGVAPWTPVALHQGTEDATAHSSATVEGVFVDQDGAPVAGVEVLHRIWPGAESTAVSDEAGHFETLLQWDSQRSGTWYRGHARKRGFARLDFEADLRAGQAFDFGRLVLEPGGTLTGEVRDAAGAPLSGAQLVLTEVEPGAPQPTGQKADEPPPSAIVDGCLSDTAGTFELVGVPPGIWAIAAKHETTWWQWSETVSLEAGETKSLDTFHLAPLPPSYRIEGRVLDPAGNPVEDAEVSTPVWSANKVALLKCTTRSSETGAFVLYLASLPRGHVDLRIDPPNDLLDETTLRDVKPGARGLVVELEATRELRLHVLDDLGQPVEHFGWSLWIRKPGSTISTGTAPAFHADGRATLRVPNRPFELEIRSDSHNDEQAGSFSPDAWPETVEVTLSSARSISGVVTSRGQPIEGAFVELVERSSDDLDGLIPGYWDGLHYSVGPATIRTDEAGRYRIPNDFPHLTYFVRAWAPGFAEGRSRAVKGRANGVRVELRAGGEVAGVVSVPEGLSPAGIELEFYRKERDLTDLDVSAGVVLRTRTSAKGTFVQPHLAPGTWLVGVRPSGTLISELGWSATKIEDEARPHVVNVTEGRRTRLDVSLGEGEFHVIEGHFTVGDKIDEGFVNLRLAPPHALDLDISYLDKDGRFRLRSRAPGTYRLVFQVGQGHYDWKAYTDVVELDSGTAKWERDLSVDLWAGNGARLDRE